MKSALKSITAVFASIIMAGCSVVGQSNVETAPYEVIESAQDNEIEIRNYESMVLASTRMAGEGRNDAFRNLFKYITGANEGEADIAMTAPVLMDAQSNAKEGKEIPMTAPVFMDENGDDAMMSFVLPKEYTLATAPKPTNDAVTLSELKNYKVAAIQFSGTLGDSNVAKHRKMLEEWIATSDYKVAGDYITAGYNAPFTLPMLRRNEVMVEVENNKIKN